MNEISRENIEYIANHLQIVACDNPNCSGGMLIEYRDLGTGMSVRVNSGKLCTDCNGSGVKIGVKDEL